MRKLVVIEGHAKVEEMKARLRSADSISHVWLKWLKLSNCGLLIEGHGQVLLCLLTA